MMKEPNINDSNLNDKAHAIRIKNMSRSERLKALTDQNDPAFYFAPNAFINVIDISREEVVAKVKINGTKDYRNYFGYDKDPYYEHPDIFDNADFLENNDSHKRQRIDDDH